MQIFACSAIYRRDPLVVIPHMVAEVISIQTSGGGS